MSVKRFLKGVAREFDPREPIIIRTERNINNLWTGRTLGGRGKILVGLGAAGYVGHQINNAPYQKIEQEAVMQDPTPLPGTLGDMQNYTPNYANAQPLEVSGDLAFALHHLRHGGW